MILDQDETAPVELQILLCIACGLGVRGIHFP